MTDETHELTPATPRPRAALRFAVAFLVGLIAALALGAGALYAYDQQYTGRILPGVQVGDIELAGLTRDEAVERVADAYRSVGDGAIQLNTPDGPLKVPFRLIQRHVDAEALVDSALGVGRSGTPVDRVIAGARTALRGASVEPSVSFDAEAVARNIERLARSLDRDPADAYVTTTEDGFDAHRGRPTDARPTPDRRSRPRWRSSASSTHRRSSRSTSRRRPSSRRSPLPRPRRPRPPPSASPSGSCSPATTRRSG